jgi:flagellar M-ring protein FliF
VFGQRSKDFPGQSVTRSTLLRVGVWIAAALLILGGLYFATGSGEISSMVPIADDRVLAKTELERITSAFRQAGLEDYRCEDGCVYVPSDCYQQYCAAIDSAVGQAFEFKSSRQEAIEDAGFLQTESARNSREQFAKSRDLARIITAFPDIRWASVDYDEQVNGGFDRQVIRSASVFLVPEDGKPIGLSRIRMVQEYVSGSYAGLEPEQVVVTDTCARESYSAIDDPGERRKRLAEYDLEQRLSHLLGGYKGLRIAATAVPGADSHVEASDQRQQNRPSRDGNHQIAPGDRIHASTPMNVSIGVPESQFHRLWINEYKTLNAESGQVPAPTAEKLKEIQGTVVANIRDAVRPLVNVTDQQADQAIRVWSYPDSETDSIRYAGQPGNSVLHRWMKLTGRSAMFWLPLVFLVTLIAVFTFLAIRMRLRSTSARGPNAANVSPQPHSTVEAGLTGAVTASGNEKVSAKEEATLRDDLAELVETNPELAAQIVHSWMGEAA